MSIDYRRWDKISDQDDLPHVLKLTLPNGALELEVTNWVAFSSADDEGYGFYYPISQLTLASGGEHGPDPSGLLRDFFTEKWRKEEFSALRAHLPGGYLEQRWRQIAPKIGLAASDNHDDVLPKGATNQNGEKVAYYCVDDLFHLEGNEHEGYRLVAHWELL